MEPPKERIVMHDWMNATAITLGMAAGLTLMGAHGASSASEGWSLLEMAAAAEVSVPAPALAHTVQPPVPNGAATPGPVGVECEEKLGELDRRIEAGLGMSAEEAAAFRQMRDLAARFCAEGNTELATPILDGLLERLGASAHEPADEPAGADLEDFTTDYLEGRWCGVSSTGETGPWLFHPDGSYEIGIRAGDGYSMRPAGSNLDAFRRLFQRVEIQEPERFVVYRHSYRTEFTRGSCAEGTGV
jgi:hypothetical protein